MDVLRFVVFLALISNSIALVIPQRGDSLSSRSSSSECEDRDTRKHTLKLIKETPFAGLFRDVKNQTKFEASGVAAVRGKFYVVFDSSMSLGYLDESFSFRGKGNTLIGDFIKESQYEGIAYVPEDDTFLLLHESMPSDDRTVATEPYKPYITTVKIKEDLSGYDVLAQCPVNFELTHENKGFESIMYVRTLKEETYLLGLCEGNSCVGGKKGRDPGNGMIIVSQLVNEGEDDCVWEPTKTINIPYSAYFADYSAMALNYGNGKIAILSQEDAAVWIGDFDIERMDFASEKGEIFHLPRDNHCEMVYCNAEGIQWLDNYRLLVASDKAKSDQPFWCDTKDQSIHIFAMPPGWQPHEPAADVNGERLAVKEGVMNTDNVDGQE